MRSLKATFSGVAPYAMVPVRLVLFASLFSRGTQKVFGLFGGPGLDGTAEYLASLGLPLAWPLAFVIGVTQIAASIAFLVGSGVRFFGLVVSAMMLVDIFLVHGANGWSFTHGGIEYNVTVIAICLSLVLHGPGWASIEWADQEGAAPDAVS